MEKYCPRLELLRHQNAIAVGTVSVTHRDCGRSRFVAFEIRMTSRKRLAKRGLGLQDASSPCEDGLVVRISQPSTKGSRVLPPSGWRRRETEAPQPAGDVREQGPGMQGVCIRCATLEIDGTLEGKGEGCTLAFTTCPKRVLVVALPNKGARLSTEKVHQRLSPLFRPLHLLDRFTSLSKFFLHYSSCRLA